MSITILVNELVAYKTKFLYSSRLPYITMHKYNYVIHSMYYDVSKNL